MHFSESKIRQLHNSKKSALLEQIKLERRREWEDRLDKGGKRPGEQALCSAFIWL